MKNLWNVYVRFYWIFYLKFVFSKKATKNWRNLHYRFGTYYKMSNLRWRFRQSLWPHQKTWTLTDYVISFSVVHQDVDGWEGELWCRKHKQWSPSWPISHDLFDFWMAGYWHTPTMEYVYYCQRLLGLQMGNCWMWWNNSVRC